MYLTLDRLTIPAGSHALLRQVSWEAYEDLRAVRCVNGPPGFAAIARTDVGKRDRGFSDIQDCLSTLFPNIVQTFSVAS